MRIQLYFYITIKKSLSLRIKIACFVERNEEKATKSKLKIHKDDREFTQSSPTDYNKRTIEIYLICISTRMWNN